MLTPEYLEHCPDDIVVLYSKLDQLIMRDVVRHIMKTGRVTDTAAWQIQRAQESGLLYAEVISEVARYANASEQQVRALFEDAGLKAIAYDSAIYTAAGLSPPPLAMSPTAQQVLQAGLAKTNGYLQNLTKTTANGAQQAYIHAATIAEMQVDSGAFDYTSAIRNAVRTAIDGGEWVTYPSGHRDRLDVASRRAVLTGVNQTAAEVSLSYADDMECDLVETTAHAGARPSHQIWQGRVFSRSGKSNDYDDFESSTGYGTGAGLCGWNCRHSFHPFFEGLSESAYPKSKLKEYENQTVTYNDEKIPYYDATQQQRAMERAIRDSKRKVAGFDEAVKSAKDDATAKAMKQEFDKAAIRLKRQEAALKDFTQQTGLLRQREREQVVATKATGKTVAFDRSLAQKAVWSAKKALQTAGNPRIIKLNEEVSAVRKSKLFSKIDTTEQYSTEYREKLKQTYKYFQNSGFEFTEHALNRTCGQKSGPGKKSFTNEQLLSVLKKPCNYKQEPDRYIRFYDGIAVVSAEDTGEIISIVIKNKARKDWSAL